MVVVFLFVFGGGFWGYNWFNIKLSLSRLYKRLVEEYRCYVSKCLSGYGAMNWPFCRYC